MIREENQYNLLKINNLYWTSVGPSDGFIVAHALLNL